MQDMSLTTAKLSNLDLVNCGELYSLSFPELDQALGQQLVSPTAATPPKRRPKVTSNAAFAELPDVAGIKQCFTHCSLVALLATAFVRNWM